MYYLSLRYFKKNLFPLIYELYDREDDPVFEYESSKAGLEKLKGCLERVKMRYYRGFYEKASYLVISINKGHFFENSNKRLALVALIAFYYKNHYEINKKNEAELIHKLKELFPKFKPERSLDMKMRELALYNLCLLIADSTKYEYNFDELKFKVKEFLQFALMKIPVSQRGK